MLLSEEPDGMVPHAYLVNQIELEALGAVWVPWVLPVLDLLVLCQLPSSPEAMDLCNTASGGAERNSRITSHIGDLRPPL